MNAEWIPMRWPAGWKSPATVGLLKGTPINWVLVDKDPSLAPVIEEAKRAGLQVAEAAAPPSGVTIVPGEWPGVAMFRNGGASAGASAGAAAGAPAGTSAGPTGVPWVDTNSWRVRLETVRQPGGNVWVDAPPKGPRVLRASSYRAAIADSAASGGKWIISLDAQLAAGLADGKADSLSIWKEIATTSGFFAAHKEWSEYVPEAVVGVVSDFVGDNEFMGQELLNLIGRTNQQYAVLMKSKLTPAGLRGLKAVIYVDSEPPSAELRKLILDFVSAGGLLITAPKWGTAPGTPARQEHPRYDSRTLGKGRVAIAKADPDDPYVLANDSTLLISHRYELLRFWNGGAVSAYLEASPDRKRGVAHLLFYSDRGPDHVSVRIAGRWRKASLWAPGQAKPQPVDVEVQKDALELHLPVLGQYAAAELEV